MESRRVFAPRKQKKDVTLTLRELIDCLTHDDEGNEFDLDSEIDILTDYGEVSYLLSVYDVDGVVTIDIGDE